MKIKTEIEIMRPEDCLGAQYIWVDGRVGHVLSLSAAMVTDKQAQAWVDANYPGESWCWL